MINQEKKEKKTKVTRKRGRPKKKDVEKKEIQPVKKKIIKRNYFFAVGRRKEAVARVRYYQKGNGGIVINAKKLQDYFPTSSLQKIVQMPLEIVDIKTGSFTIKVKGGGKKGQAESIRLGIARVLEKFDSNLRGPLKREGLLRRDARVKERKKYGLRGARRAPQWRKR